MTYIKATEQLLTRKAAIRLLAGFILRIAICGVIGLILMVPIGFVSAFVLDVLDAQSGTRYLVAHCTGATVIAICPVIAFLLMINRDFGDFRLTLLQRNA